MAPPYNRPRTLQSGVRHGQRRFADAARQDLQRQSRQDTAGSRKEEKDRTRKARNPAEVANITAANLRQTERGAGLPRLFLFIDANAVSRGLAARSGGHAGRGLLTQ